MCLSLQLDFIMSLSRAGMVSPSSLYLPLCLRTRYMFNNAHGIKNEVGLSKEGCGQLVLVSDEGTGADEKEISGLMVEKDGV